MGDSVNTILSKFDLYNTSNENLEKLIEELKGLEVEERIPQIDFNIGVAYLNLNQIDVAREYFQKAIDIDNEYIAFGITWVQLTRRNWILSEPWKFTVMV